MIKRPTTYVAADLAASLTSARRVVSLRYDNSPLTVASHMLMTPFEPKEGEFTMERREEIRDAFAQANQDLGEQHDETFQIVTDNLAKGLQQMLQVARTVIVPACKQVKEVYDNVESSSRVPEISITPVAFHPVHREPALTEHLANTYAGYRVMDEYRSFRITPPAESTFFEWLSDNNHLTKEQTQAWLASIDATEVFRDVWYNLFQHSRTVTPSTLEFAQRGRLPFTFDHLLMAYLTTAHLCGDPQSLDGESASLEEWEAAMICLHSMLGSTLLHAYQWRAKAERQRRVVFRYETPKGNQIHTPHKVWVNPDVYNDWLQDGGSPKVLLGASIVAPAAMASADFKGRHDELIAAWDRHHHLKRQVVLDRFLSQRRETLQMLLLDRPDGEGYDLPELDYDTLRTRVNHELAALKEDDLDDMWRTITTLVCNVYYPNTPYRGFLESMDRISKTQPELPPRELATLATVEMLSRWLTNQMGSASFEVAETKPAVVTEE